MISNALLFLVGLVILVIAAELLVRGASRLALTLGVPPVVIGLTVVAFGTSAPELVVSLTAALRGGEGIDLALGNVVGSNIFNIGAILGASALTLPLKVNRRIVRFDCPVMIGATLALVAFAWDGTITRAESLALLVAFGVTLGLTLSNHGGGVADAERAPEPDATEPTATDESASPAPGSLGLDLVFIVVGLAGLLGGGHLVVTSAVAIARGLGVSELVIGLTIVAAGTSMPELATSIVAGLRGQPDLAVGNVVGSNLFNVLLILGVTGTVTPLPVQQPLFAFDLPVLVGFTAATWPVLGAGPVVGRKRGALLVLAYFATLGLWIANARR